MIDRIAVERSLGSGLNGSIYGASWALVWHVMGVWPAVGVTDDSWVLFAPLLAGAVWVAWSLCWFAVADPHDDTARTQQY